MSSWGRIGEACERKCAVRRIHRDVTGRILWPSERVFGQVYEIVRQAMKTTSGTTLMALALGIFCGSGWVAAQETGVVSSGQGAPATVQSPVAVDNGAMPGDSHVRIVRLS